MNAPDENTTPEELEEIRKIARVANFLPDIDALLNSKIKMALSIADGQIDRHEMTPELAFSIVHEIHAYRKVLKTLTVQGRMPTSNG
jgi:cell wall assembly regulator SMI1